MDFTRSLLVLGTICLLICIPSMNVIVTAGHVESSKLVNESCSASPICRGGVQTVDPEILDFGPVIIGQAVVKDIRIRSYNRSFEVSRVVQRESCLQQLYLQLNPKTVKSDLFVFKIRVALVPKLIGAFDGVITVFTGMGRIRIPVQAQIAPSPFRIFPIEHSRVPLGSTFATDVVVYNPFGSTLHVIQLYLSGGPFHLTLPENVEKPVSQHITPADKDKWDIPAFTAHTIATVIVDTSRAFHEKSYLRIKFNSTVFDEVVIPIDVTVFEGSGLYSLDGVINFGFVQSTAEPLTVPLRLRLSKPCLTRHIDDVYDTNQVPLVSSTVVQRSVSDVGGPTVVANLKLNANASLITGRISGEIVVKNGLERLLIPYRAYIGDGGIFVPDDSGAWHMEAGSGSPSVEVITIHNDYPIPLVVVDASVMGDKHCSDSEIVESNFPVMIPPRSSAAVASVRNRVKTRIPHTVTVSLMSNLESGVTEVPLSLYTGELRMDTSGINQWLWHGMLFNCNETGILAFRNINPTVVHVLDVELTSDCLQVDTVTVCRATDNCSMPIKFEPLTLESGSVVRLAVTGTRLKREGKCQSTLRVTTNFQVLVVHLGIAVIPGRLELYEYPVIIEDIFPSRAVQRNITIFNTFDKPIEIQNVYSEEFSRLRMDPSLDGVEVGAHMGLVFDTLTFDARFLCKELPGLCYVGFDLDGTNEKAEAWKRPFRMVTHSSVEIDRRMKERQLEIWNNLSGGNSSFQIESTLTVSTRQSYVFHLPVTLNFVWPPPLITSNHESLEFPLLSVGNFSEMDVEVSNPADKNLFVHAYVFRDDKAASWNRDIFYVKSIVPKGTTQGFYGVDDERLPEKSRLPFALARGSAASIVPYGGQFLVRVVFQPQSEACYTAVLHIRNNLTVVESIPIRGCGVEPQIRFSNEGTVPPTPTLTMKFTGKDAAYCRNRTADMADRSKITRTGRVAVTNTVGAYLTVESVKIVEDNWYHRSFSLTKQISPFLLAPNKTRRLSVEFNPDFGVSQKVGKILVFVSDRVDPFMFEVTGEVDATAMRLCRPCFGRSENDLWIRYILLSRRWGWMLYLLPVIFFGGYISFIRDWYTKRLKNQFLQRYSTLLDQKVGGDKFSQKASDQLAIGTDGDARRRPAKRKGNPPRPSDPKETEDLPNLLQQTDQPMSLCESVEKQIPENLRELFCVAYFASVPYTFLRNFRFPTRRLYRIFFVLEVVAFPVRLTMTLLKCIVYWVCGLFGWRFFSSESERNTDYVITLSAVGSFGCRNVVVGGPQWSVGDWKRFLNVFPSYAKVAPESDSTKENGSAVPLANGRAVTGARSGILSSKDHSGKNPSSSPPVATVAPVKRPSAPKPPTPQPSPRPVVTALKISPTPLSRDSSSADNVDSGSDEPEMGDRNSPDDESKSSRKLRRRQMHQAKLTAERTAKLQKTYNKPQRKAEERKALEAQTELVLADDKTSIEPSSDSEVERVQRIEAAKRKAKLEADRLAKKTAKANAVADNGHKGLEPSAVIQSRPISYPIQTEVIQQAFFKVEPRENGLMFTEMSRDECFQLVKQLKRDRPNLFQLDPKAAVELLQQTTRTNRYRLNGDYVDLAMKSTVTAYTGSSRSRKDVISGAEYGSISRQSVRPHVLSQQTQRATDQRSPESGWSFSPTGSENGNSRLSPFVLSYADVAGQQRKSVDSAPQQSSDSSDTWKSSQSPQSKTPELSRFPWDEPLLAGPFDRSCTATPSEQDDVGLLNAYQRRQRDLVDEASGRFCRGDRSLFFRSESRELENYLADLESKNRDELRNVTTNVTTAWPDSFVGSGMAVQNIWQDGAVGSSGWGNFESETKNEAVSWPTASSSTDSQPQSTNWPNSIWSTSSFFTSTPEEEQPQFFGAIGESLKLKRRVDKF